MDCKLFTTQSCPKCPSFKKRLEEFSNINVENVNASTPEGLDEARKYSVSSVPTAIFFENGNEKARAYSIEDIDSIL